jgi:hypothetical protein
MFSNLGRSPMVYQLESRGRSGHSARNNGRGGNRSLRDEFHIARGFQKWELERDDILNSGLYDAVG